MSNVTSSSKTASKKEAEYTRESLSIFQDEDKKWNLVRIQYNQNTSEVGPIEVLQTHEDWYEIMGAFESRIDDKVLNDSN